MEFLGNSSESEDEVQEQPHVAKTARVRELEPGSSVAELPEQKLSNMDVNKRMKLKLLEKYSKIFKHTTASPSKSTFPKKSGNVVEVESPTMAPINNHEEQQEAGCWAEAFDKSSGKPYYYHTTSGQTSWDRPDSLSTMPTLSGLPTPNKRKLQDAIVDNEAGESSLVHTRKVERRLNDPKYHVAFSKVDGMRVINQSDVLNNVECAEAHELKDVEQPPIRTQKWSIERGEFVTTGISSAMSRSKNSIQSLASQAILHQRVLDAHTGKLGKSLKQSRAKYGW